MRAGLSTIQQTLTPEAANVLNQSIAEASRRNHGQTTPLHVAATLLGSPSGFFRQACIKSHPNSSHPLQCRALELCFSVALEQISAAQNAVPDVDPPISNALMAALKRAQAHQRRGCPEQQQQPLLAVKVELEQLIISILDDPNVSKVMREASFSSTAVKATIEQSLNSSTSTSANSGPIGLGFRPVAAAVPSPNRNSYLNPRLQQGAAVHSGQQRSDEMKRVMDILLRTRRRNPVLVGESEPELVVKEILRKVENKEIGDGLLRNVEVIHLEKDFALDKSQMVSKIKDLGDLIEARLRNSDCGGIIIDLGDLKWLVERQHVGIGVGSGAGGGVQQLVVSEVARAAVTEMGRLLVRFRDGGGGSSGGGRVWLIGTATCETYMRCQVYHSSMENDWDLQAVPIAARASLPGMFPRFGSNGILSNSVESFSHLKGFATTTAQPRRLPENGDPAQKIGCCPQCTQNYEQELAKLAAAKEFEKASPEATQPTLPQWLQIAKVQGSDGKTSSQARTKDQEMLWKQRTQELQKKWNDTCLYLHRNLHQSNPGSERFASPAFSITSLHNSSLIGRQPFQPKVQLNTVQLNTNLVASQSIERTSTPPGSPVRTDLILGQSKVSQITSDRTLKESPRDFLGCISSEPQKKFNELESNELLDPNCYKKLLKGLLEKVWWQRDAASAVATTVTRCKLGNGKRQGAGSKGDIWLLFTGPDRVGKKKMALALSEQVCGVSPVTICLGSRRDDRESDMSFRGKTVLDRIAEAVRRNPFSVIILEDIDEADMLVRGSIKRAMERGRLADSHHREISLGNVIFILTAKWLPDNLKFLSDGTSLDEEKLASIASGSWRFRLSLCEKTSKRRASWPHEEERATKSKRETSSGLSFDLNEAADIEEDKADGSHNSSDLTVDHEEEHRLTNRLLSNSTSSVSSELLNSLDDAIVFKPVDFGPIRQDIASSITKKFSSIVGDRLSIEIPGEALEKITCGVWIGQTGLEEWTEKVLVPTLHQLKSRVPATSDESLVVRLELDGESDNPSNDSWLPSSINVAIDPL